MLDLGLFLQGHFLGHIGHFHKSLVRRACEISAILHRALLINLFKENEYDSDVYSPLPKHRNASLRERVSSVNSEVTIHDVRRCTITGT